jgi:thioesterase domain-containing protein
VSGEIDPGAIVDPRAIEAYLLRRIPIAAAMGIRVAAADPALVRLAVPFAPNINAEPHSARFGAGSGGEAAGDIQAAGATGGDMVFGGSAVAAAILAAWTLLYVRERAAGGSARLLIQRSAIRYERPITADFEAVCELTDEAAYGRFRRMLARHGRARLTLGSALLQEGRRAASFEGDFVALRPAPAD